MVPDPKQKNKTIVQKFADYLVSPLTTLVRAAALTVAVASCGVGCGRDYKKPPVNGLENVVRVYAPADYTLDGQSDILGITSSGELQIFAANNEDQLFVHGQLIDPDGSHVSAAYAFGGGKMVIAGLSEGEIRAYHHSNGAWNLEQKINHPTLQGSGRGFVTSITSVKVAHENYILVGVQAPTASSFSSESGRTFSEGSDSSFSKDENSFGSFSGDSSFSFGEKRAPSNSFSEDNSFSFSTDKPSQNSFSKKTFSSKSSFTGKDFSSKNVREQYLPYNLIFRINEGKLEDVSKSSLWTEIYAHGGKQTYGIAHFEIDGKNMLYVANDFADDNLFKLEKDQFHSLPLPLQMTGPTYSMGVLARINSDKTASVFVTDLNRMLEYIVTSEGVDKVNQTIFSKNPDASLGALVPWAIQEYQHNLVVGFGGIYPGSAGNQLLPPQGPGIMIFNHKKRCSYSGNDAHQMTFITHQDNVYAITQRFPGFPGIEQKVDIYQLDLMSEECQGFEP